MRWAWGAAAPAGAGRTHHRHPLAAHGRRRGSECQEDTPAVAALRRTAGGVASRLCRVWPASCSTRPGDPHGRAAAARSSVATQVDGGSGCHHPTGGPAAGASPPAHTTRGGSPAALPPAVAGTGIAALADAAAAPAPAAAGRQEEANQVIDLTAEGAAAAAAALSQEEQRQQREEAHGAWRRRRRDAQAQNAQVLCRWEDEFKGCRLLSASPCSNE